ncbi:PAS domain-containing protein [Rhodobacter sp. JA431]|uniref:PAS-domain containing protein n=1 Tax=Rhodobacter sp. JA431 TaxID=570013 RepID=UPI000BDC3D19|nr:PAS-domain containing protein [Rhodobacter sp. JA431]SOC08041.1 PAS domain-containing protein [Rhodobacter sp. JA431]
MQVEYLQAIIIVVTSVGSVAIGLLAVTFLTGRKKAPRKSSSVHPVLEQTVFLFDDRDLVDATPPARLLLDAAPMAADDWTRLCAFISPRFEGFAERMAQLSERGKIEIRAKLEEGRTLPLQLVAEDVNGLARITLIDPEAEGRGVLVDGLSQRALEDELDHMRQTLDRAPVLIWREDASGMLTWANRAYVLRSGAFSESDDSLIWPLPRLFDLDPALRPGSMRRMRLEQAPDKIDWFDCHSYPLERGSLHFAVPADATVRAEAALRDFVQTLSKTFADLPIGLAVFDRSRRLQIFNPSLIDLTQLGAEFLSTRPTLYAFLDRLREARMMPEPKDYRTWRLQMTELERAAASGYHCETWNLPSGQTYRVTGRPHPDGAVAFLFEDISAESAMARRMRAELEQGQEVLDQMGEAVAVFQSSGEMTASNAAYDRLWGTGVAHSVSRSTIADAVRLWQAQCEQTSLWAEARSFNTTLGVRRLVEGEVIRRIDGEPIDCRFVPLTGGAMLASFRPRHRALIAPEQPKPVPQAESTALLLR